MEKQLSEGQEVECSFKCFINEEQLIHENKKFKFVIGSGKVLKGFEDAVLAAYR